MLEPVEQTSVSEPRPMRAALLLFLICLAEQATWDWRNFSLWQDFQAWWELGDSAPRF